MANPTNWLLVSNIVIVVGILLTAAGGFGSYYFNRKIADLAVSKNKHPFSTFRKVSSSLGVP